MRPHKFFVALGLFLSVSTVFIRLQNYNTPVPNLDTTFVKYTIIIVIFSIYWKTCCSDITKRIFNIVVLLSLSLEIQYVSSSRFRILKDYREKLRNKINRLKYEVVNKKNNNTVFFPCRNTLTVVVRCQDDEELWW